MIKKAIDWLFGGGKRFFAMVCMTVIFIFLIPKNGITFGIYSTFMTAWAGLETIRRGGSE